MNVNDDSDVPSPAIEAAAVAMLRRYRGQRQVLLVKRGMRNLQGRVMAFAGAWVFPGGKLDPGETACEAAIREAREEVAIELHPASLVKVWNLPSTSWDDRRYDTTYFAARTAADQVPTMATGEVVDLRWLEVEDAVARSSNGTMAIPPATTRTLERLLERRVV